MKVIFKDTFKKDLSKIKDSVSRKQIIKAILKAEKAESLQKLTHLKAIKGEKNAYRLRAGDYRIGVIMQSDILYMARVAHRKDIYKFFP